MPARESASCSCSQGERADRVVWLSRLAWVRIAGLVLLLAMFLWVKFLHGQVENSGQNAGADESANSGASAGPRLVRLTDVEGGVQVVSADNTQFPQVVQNMPLLEGMRVVTPNDAKAEIEFEDGSVVRLAPDSAVTLDHLSIESGANNSQISIGNGLVYLELRAADDAKYTVGYGDGSFVPVQNSTVRVNLDSQPAELAVFTGEISVQRAGGVTVEVMANESLKGDGSDGSRYFLSQTITSDSWDQWNNDRDAADSVVAAQQTTARDDYEGENGYGWSDLDANGSWYPVPGRGLMWQPAGYTAGFDPYGVGYWVDYPGYGYEWVSGYPWGWVPYRCGEWYYLDGFGWGWMPTGGCRTYWGRRFVGGRVNIAATPGGYVFPLRPGTPRGPHPIVVIGGGVVRSGAMAEAGFMGGSIRTEKQFAGQALRPLQPEPVGMVAAKDYPVNPSTSRPVLGKVSLPKTGVSRPPVSNARQGYGNSGRSNGSAGYSQPRYSPPPASSRPSYSPPPSSAGRSSSPPASGGGKR